jgi:hypothetical protein
MLAPGCVSLCLGFVSPHQFVADMKNEFSRHNANPGKGLRGFVALDTRAPLSGNEF